MSALYFSVAHLYRWELNIAYVYIWFTLPYPSEQGILICFDYYLEGFLLLNETLLLDYNDMTECAFNFSCCSSKWSEIAEPLQRNVLCETFPVNHI